MRDDGGMDTQKKRDGAARGYVERVRRLRGGVAGENPLVDRKKKKGGDDGRLSGIGVSDVLLVVGLGLFGAGLFFWWGVGVALTMVGGVMFVWGMFGGAGPGKGN